MPMVRVEWIKGVDQKAKNEIARAIVDLLRDNAGVPPSATQVLFVDCEDVDWFAGYDSVADLRKRKAER